MKLNKVRQTKTGRITFKDVPFKSLKLDSSFTHVREGQRVMAGEVALAIALGTDERAGDVLKLHLNEAEIKKLIADLTDKLAWFAEERNK